MPGEDACLIFSLAELLFTGILVSPLELLFSLSSCSDLSPEQDRSVTFSALEMAFVAIAETSSREGEGRSPGQVGLGGGGLGQKYWVPHNNDDDTRTCMTPCMTGLTTALGLKTWLSDRLAKNAFCVKTPFMWKFRQNTRTDLLTGKISLGSEHVSLLSIRHRVNGFVAHAAS